AADRGDRAARPLRAGRGGRCGLRPGGRDRARQRCRPGGRPAGAAGAGAPPVAVDRARRAAADGRAGGGGACRRRRAGRRRPPSGANRPHPRRDREGWRERRSYVTGAPDFDPLVRGLRRLSHDLVMIGRSLRAPLPEAVAVRLAAPAAAVAAAMSAYLAGLGETLTGAELPAPNRLDHAFAEFDAALVAIRRDGLARDLGVEDVERVFGLAFALEQTRRNLAEFAARAGEVRGA